MRVTVLRPTARYIPPKPKFKFPISAFIRRLPDWRQLYAATVIETNSEHLDLLVEETLRAIEARLDELLQLKGYDDEGRKIHEASKSLLILRADLRLWNREQPS